jgi:teichuronic acid biosynthesis glycosyltransferase TuaC
MMMGTRPLHVLHVIPGVGQGASMVFSRLQIAALERQGVRVTKFFLESRTRPLPLLAALRQLRRVAAATRPDIIHAQYGTITAALSALVPLPLVVTFRGSDLNPDPAVSALRSRSQKLLSHFAALKAARIVCVSERLKTCLIWGRGRAHVLPSGVDLHIFKPMPQADARAALGWPLNEKVVLFNAAGPPEVKRVDRAEAASAIAANAVPAIRFVAMRGGYSPDEVCRLMNAADCLLLTSEWEGSPTVVQEALACNLPVVSVDVGDVPERLAGVTPSAMTGPRPAEIAGGLIQILKEPRRSNGAAFAAGVSHDALATKLIDIYREIVA